MIPKLTGTCTITGLRTQPVQTPSAWRPRDLETRDGWVFELARDQIDELTTIATRISVAGQTPPVLTHKSFSLATWDKLIEKLRTQLEGGLGFALIRSLPVEDISADVARTMLWGMGHRLGYPEPQDASGSLLHDVRDTGQDLEIDNIRAYQTNLPIHYHNDGADALALLCYHAAPSGGESQLVSAVSVFNEILNRRPDLAAVLQTPFYFDARGQEGPGSPPYQRIPIYTYHANHLNVLYKRQYIDLAQRFPDVPKLTSQQIEALDLMDRICEELAFQFTMEPGDVVVANNYDILHARSAFQDKDADLRRHMMRLWLSLPNGRPLPPVFEHTREFCHSYARRSTQI